MFKAPKYRDFLDPKHVPLGYLQSVADIVSLSDRDFRTAITEAYSQFSDAIDKLVDVRVRRRPAAAQKKAQKVLGIKKNAIIALLGGILGPCLDREKNEWTNKQVKELLIAATRRSWRHSNKPTGQQYGRLKKIGFRVPFVLRNAPKRRR